MSCYLLFRSLSDMKYKALGKSSISFRNRGDVNLDVLGEMVEHAGRIVATET